MVYCAPQVQGKYQFQPPLPFSPGSECAGVVVQLGRGVDDVHVGDKVLAASGWGCFAQYLVADAVRLIKVPEGVPMDVAASFLMTYGTTLYALKQRAQLRAGESVLVLGAAGGVGLAAVDLARAMGASKIIAAASSDEKLEVCKRFGATHTINYARESLKDRLKDLTDGEGVDVVYDPVGDKYSEPAIRNLAWNGRYLVIGFAGGAIPKLPLNLLLLKGASAVGVFWGKFTSTEPEENARNTRELFAMIREGRIKPWVSAHYPLHDVQRALGDMMARKVLGKAVIRCQPDSSPKL